MLILNEEQSKKFKELQVLNFKNKQNQETEEDGIRAEYMRRMKVLRLRNASQEEVQKLTELFKGYLGED